MSLQEYDDSKPRANIALFFNDNVETADTSTTLTTL